MYAAQIPAAVGFSGEPFNLAQLLKLLVTGLFTGGEVGDEVGDETGANIGVFVTGFLGGGLIITGLRKIVGIDEGVGDGPVAKSLPNLWDSTL